MCRLFVLTIAALFEKLQKAYEILCTESLKAIYDNKLKAKRDRAKRLVTEDANQNVLRAKLFRAEEEAAKREAAIKSKQPTMTDSKKRKQEEEQTKAQSLHYIRTMMQSQTDIKKHKSDTPFYTTNTSKTTTTTPSVTSTPSTNSNSSSTVSLKWSKDSPFALNTHESILRSLFSRYGEIEKIIIKPNKYKAFIIFNSKQAAVSETLILVSMSLLIYSIWYSRVVTLGTYYTCRCFVLFLFLCYFYQSNAVSFGSIDHGIQIEMKVMGDESESKEPSIPSKHTSTTIPITTSSSAIPTPTSTEMTEDEYEMQTLLRMQALAKARREKQTQSTQSSETT